jgi:hypothetical protein
MFVQILALKNNYYRRFGNLKYSFYLCTELWRFLGFARPREVKTEFIDLLNVRGCK